MSKAYRQASVHRRLLTIEELDQVREYPDLAPRVGRTLSADHPGLYFPNGVTLGLATTQPKKLKEMTDPLSMRPEHVKVINPVEWLGWWLSADEVSHTYLGNAYEKAQSLIDRVYNHIGYDNFMTAMKRRGLNADNFAFIVNDTGSSMVSNYSNEPEFVRSSKEYTMGSWPGVETGPILDAQGGVAAFHSSLKNMKRRLKAQDLEEAYDDRGWDEVTYLMFKLKPDPGTIDILCYEARIPLRYHTQPGRNSGEVLTSHDFLSLDLPDLPEHVRAKRIADFRDDFFRRYSPMAMAVNQLVDDMHVPNKLSPAFGRAAKPQPLVIATQANLIAAQNGAHKPDVSNVKGLEYQPTSYSQQFDRGADGIIDDLCRGSNGVVLTRHNQDVLADWDNHFLDLFDIWATLIVNKQVLVEQSYGKPLIVLSDKKHFSYKNIFNGHLDWDDPNVERAFVDFIGKIDPAQDPWLKFVMLTRYLHEKNFVKQEPHFLFTQLSPETPDLVQQIKGMMEEGLKERIPVPEYKPEYFGRDRTDLFEVSILGSAGTRVTAYTDEAEELGYWAASQGMHVRTGGGNYGIMGAAARGVLRYMGEHQHSPQRCHLSLIQMPRTLQFEGAAVDPKDIKEESAALGDRANKFMAVERDFDERMDSIFRSNISVAMAPGIGTYQEVVRWLRLKHSGEARHLENQKLILVNAAQPGLEEGIRLMDPFLKILPKHILENDIIIVPDVEHAQDIVHKAYNRYRHEHMHGPTRPATTEYTQRLG